MNRDLVEAPEYDTYDSEQLIPKKESRFKQSTFKDSWAFFLWVASLAVFAYIAFMGLSALSNTSNTDPFEGSVYITKGDMAGILLCTLITAFALSFAYFLAIERYSTT